MQVPEMQAFKKKYPVYKDFDDERLLDAVVSKWPVYQKVRDRVASEKQESKINEDTARIAGEQFPKDIKTYAINALKEAPKMLPAVSTIEELERFGAEKRARIASGEEPGVPKEFTAEYNLQRPVAAIQQLAAGEPEKMGEAFRKPETAPSFMESTMKAYGTSHPYIAATVASVLDTGVPAITYGAVSKAITAPVEAARKAYAGVQGRVLDELENQLVKEFVKGGVNEAKARPYVKTQLYNQWVKTGTLQKTPGKIAQTVKFLKENEGKLAEGIREKVLDVEATRYADAMVKKAQASGAILSPGFDKTQRLGLLKERYKAVMRKARGKAVPTPKDIVESVGGKVRGISDLKNSIYKGEPTVYFDDFSGSTRTLPLSKVTAENVKAKMGVLGSQKGFILLPDMGDVNAAITDLQGEVQVMGKEYGKWAKRFGTPFFLGQKYPQFKPIYTAVQNGVDLNAELFFEAMDILRPMELRSVPKASQDKILNALKTGNDPAVRKDFTPQELAERFKLDEKEVEIYNKFRKLYKLGLNMEMKKRKILMDYISMSPEEQRALDIKFQETVKKLGGGYMSQMRSEGVWGVYKPPAKPGEKPQFFTRVGRKSEAMKIADQLGEGATYGMMDTSGREAYRHLTLTDLENLIASAKVEETPVAKKALDALRDELKKRTFLAHWIRRRNIPGYEWTWDNAIDSAIDYAAGAANSLSRVSGRTSAEAAYQLTTKGMSPELRLYSRNFIEGFYNTGTLGYGAVNKLLYSWKLAFKVSWLFQNLSQPMTTTYPLLAHYYGGLVPERVFLSSYKLAGQFLAHKWQGAPHGMSSELYSILQRAERQGVLGDQMTKFQLGARQLSKQEFEKWLGLFGRAGEAVNRSHAAIAGYRVATDVLKLQGEENIYAFVKEFVGKTQFLYGKQNIPTVIPTSGVLKNALRTAYTFRHFNVSYIQMLNSMMPWRGGLPREYTRALTALGLQTGIKGLPFAAIAFAIYKWYKEKVAKEGGNAETDMRKAMTEAGIPREEQDVILSGFYTLAGVDASSLIGAGDVIPTYGTEAEKFGGAAVGFARQMTKALTYVAQGDYARAMETAAPDAIRNLLKAKRYAEEGVRKDTGELITSPSMLDVAMQALGFTPHRVTKAYAAREAISSMRETHVNTQSGFNRRLAQARMDRDWEGYRKVLLEMKEFNKTKSRESKVKSSVQSQRSWRKKFQGINENVPRAQRKTARELVEMYGVKEK